MMKSLTFYIFFLVGLCLISSVFCVKDDDTSLLTEFEARFQKVLLNTSKQFEQEFWVGLHRLNFRPRFYAKNQKCLDAFISGAMNSARSTFVYNTSFAWFTQENQGRALKLSIDEIIDGGEFLSQKPNFTFAGWTDGNSTKVAIEKLESAYSPILSEWQETTEKINQALLDLSRGLVSKDKVLAEINEINTQARHLGLKALFALQDEVESAAKVNKLIPLAIYFRLRFLNFFGVHLHNFNIAFVNLANSIH